MTPSKLLEQNRQKILEIVAAHHAAKPRVFGSVLHGKDTERSDLDLLVDPLPGATLLDLGGIQIDLEDLLGIPVDVLTPGDLPEKFRQQVLQEARAL
ncbi:DNA polymerase, beta-like region [Candidatus Accumulibacter aalborgensis]|uniref:DNA polymerase, beta-like region n=1 Tax=Candidatus Accumulibacter aalborgensis TaxID=1860102 RepID=A0A1A8XFZ9_9PROT|nr:DNA polymerase, beta-like region [Candidatus Accumulibacter aalborgensis]